MTDATLGLFPKSESVATTSTSHRRARTAAERLELVQVLRALAALLVLVGHVKGQVLRGAAKAGLVMAPVAWPGGFGVDLFFCISGFIMVVSSQKLFGTPGAARAFLVRRVCRLVPLYWLITLAYLPAVIFGRAGVEGSLWKAIATSLLFIPYPTFGMENSVVFPIYTLGWSLNYEMFFYLLFSLYVAAKRPVAVAFTLLTLSAVCAGGALLHPAAATLHFWSRPILLEFALGVLAGHWWVSGAALPKRLSLAASLMLLSTALAVLWTDPEHLLSQAIGTTTANDIQRVLGWGIPAILILIAALLVQRHVPHIRIFAPLVLLGDCSYSLYLTHPFALIGAEKAASMMGVTSPAGWIGLGAVMAVVAILLALASFRLVEKPLTPRLQPLLMRERA